MISLDKLINKNIKSIPYEGLDINKEGLIEDFKNVMKGFLTFSKTYELTNKGYLKNGIYYSREEVINHYLTN